MSSLIKCFIILGLISSASVADKGDIFLNTAAMTAISEVDFISGAQLGFDFGFNEQTDIALTASFLAAPEMDIFNSRIYLASYFTPYFGEIRPRIGGSFGLAHYYNSLTDVNEVMPDLGIHLQGLMSLSSNLYLLGEVSPHISFGSEGGVITMIKVGLNYQSQNNQDRTVANS